MICKNATYVNFRNIAGQTLDFGDGINLICGDNAQGKTNALEGIFLIAQGRSHRTSKEKEFIKFGESFAGVSLCYDTCDRQDIRLSLKYTADGKKYCEKNGVAIKKMSEFIGNFRAIIFTPEHLSIIKDGPSNRRFFIDFALSQLYPGYICDLQSYNRVLSQRNRLIQTAFADRKGFEDTVGLWSENLAALCEKISVAREKYTARLNCLAGDIFDDMTKGSEKLVIEYSGAKSREDYMRLLCENLDREVRHGTTLYGTHKDDLSITINNSTARSFGSQGQQRSAALAMKLAEGEISKETGGEYPVFLFDDILSELDKNRREYIMNGIGGRQVIITSCDRDEGLHIKNGNVIYCRGGSYTRRI